MSSNDILMRTSEHGQRYELQANQQRYDAMGNLGRGIGMGLQSAVSSYYDQQQRQFENQQKAQEMKMERAFNERQLEQSAQKIQLTAQLQDIQERDLTIKGAREDRMFMQEQRRAMMAQQTMDLREREAGPPSGVGDELLKNGDGDWYKMILGPDGKWTDRLLKDQSEGVQREWLRQQEEKTKRRALDIKWREKRAGGGEGGGGDDFNINEEMNETSAPPQGPSAPPAAGGGVNVKGLVDYLFGSSDLTPRQKKEKAKEIERDHLMRENVMGALGEVQGTRMGWYPNTRMKMDRVASNPSMSLMQWRNPGDLEGAQHNDRLVAEMIGKVATLWSKTPQEVMAELENDPMHTIWRAMEADYIGLPGEPKRPRKR